MSREAGRARTAPRVLVAMDGSAYGLAAVEAAVHLAAELGAEVLGLFVEDANLLRLAGLPVAREVPLSCAAPRSLDPLAMERLLRAQADQVRQALAEAAARVGVAWSFRVARGHVVRASLETAADLDLVVLGKENSAPQAPPPRFAPRARASACPLLLVFDGSPSSRRALDTAAHLARTMDCQVVVVIETGDEDCEELTRRATQPLEQAGVAVSVQPAVLRSAAQLIGEARRTKAKLVLLSRCSDLLDEATLELLVNELDCPVALVQ